MLGPAQAPQARGRCARRFAAVPRFEVLSPFDPVPRIEAPFGFDRADSRAPDRAALLLPPPRMPLPLMRRFP
jgi:hypothetical protein